MTTTTDAAKSPEQLRAEASERIRLAEESWERSDTDGFLSQWALSITARKLQLQAEINEAGGKAEFWGLYTKDGRRVKAKEIKVAAYHRNGAVDKWCIFTAGGGRIYAPLNYGKGSKRSKVAQLGLVERREMAPAEAFIDGHGRGLSGSAWASYKRTDGGFPADAVPFGGCEMVDMAKRESSLRRAFAFMEGEAERQRKDEAFRRASRRLARLTRENPLSDPHGLAVVALDATGAVSTTARLLAASKQIARLDREGWE